MAVGLTVSLTLFLVIPGPRTPGFVMLLVVIVLSPPTHCLSRRFSDDRRQARPIPLSQEQAVGLLALVASLLSISTFAACILGSRWGWPTDRVVPMPVAFSVSALLSLRLGQAARHTAAGRWGMRLTVGLLAVVIGVLDVPRQKVQAAHPGPDRM